MKKWIVTVNVNSVHGTQSWAVDAEDKAGAIAAFKRGEGEFSHEELEVRDFNDPDEDCVEEA